MKLYCKQCNDYQTAYIWPKILQTKKGPRLQIRADCLNCERFVKFMPHTEEVTDHVNEKMDLIRTYLLQP